jgi:hypothetical protein
MLSSWKVHQALIRVDGQAIDRPVEFFESAKGPRVLLLEQGFAALAGGAQLWHAAIAGGAVQAMDAFDQGIVVVASLRLTDRFAVGFQRGQQHRQHVRRQVGLAGGQAQAFFVVEHRQFGTAVAVALRSGCWLRRPGHSISAPLAPVAAR